MLLPFSDSVRVVPQYGPSRFAHCPLAPPVFWSALLSGCGAGGVPTVPAVPDVRCSAFLVSELPAVLTLFFSAAVADGPDGDVVVEDVVVALLFVLLLALPLALPFAGCVGGAVSVAGCVGGAVSVGVAGVASVCAALSDAVAEFSLPVDDGSATAPLATPKLKTTVRAAMKTAGERNGLLDARVMLRPSSPQPQMETGIEKPS